MARKSTSKPVSAKAPAKPVKTDLFGKPVLFTLGDADPDLWLHYHTHPLAYPAPSDEKLYDVWQVDPWMGELERVAAAVSEKSCPLTLVRDYFHDGDRIAFLTPHIEGDEIEHFLKMICQCAGFLDRQAREDFAVEKIPSPPLRKRETVGPAKADVPCKRIPNSGAIAAMKMIDTHPKKAKRTEVPR